MNINTSGKLYLVSTPIGNRQDITLRAIETLKMVDLIAAEDTRHSLPLLQHFAINKQLVALHEHNEHLQAEKLITRLKNGESIALISDAGTPLVSDPGYHLVQYAKLSGIQVVPIPGPCAAIAALSVSGLATDRFVFEGFLPAKSQLRLQRLKELREEPRTIILYEAPHRILDLLNDLQQVLGLDREIVIARELTKLFETIKSGKINEILNWMIEDVNQQRGEFVVVISGIEKREEPVNSVPMDSLLKLLLAELSVKKAAELAAKISGKRKNELYQRALELKSLPQK
jgi:16S rRNA (cytidine1402-2'-O)-methyltransferase